MDILSMLLLLLHYLCLDFILIIRQNSITAMVELRGILTCILTEKP